MSNVQKIRWKEPAANVIQYVSAITSCYSLDQYYINNTYTGNLYLVSGLRSLALTHNFSHILSYLAYKDLQGKLDDVSSQSSEDEEEESKASKGRTDRLLS